MSDLVSIHSSVPCSPSGDTTNSRFGNGVLLRFLAPPSFLRLKIGKFAQLGALSFGGRGCCGEIGVFVIMFMELLVMPRETEGAVLDLEGALWLESPLSWTSLLDR